MAELPHTHLEDTFQVNFFALARVVQAALPHLHAGDSIIATSSISAHRGNQQLVDYTSAKAALTFCIRSNFTAASREADTSQHGSAWPHLDAARPRPLPTRQGSRVRPEYHNEAPQPARQRGGPPSCFRPPQMPRIARVRPSVPTAARYSIRNLILVFLDSDLSAGCELGG
jgi:hypothetical protein